MAVTYDKIAYPLIENGLKKIIDNEFNNVYVSPIFKMLGNECIRINLLSSTNLETSNAFEQREYNVIVRYYFLGDMSVSYVNESVKNKIDKLRKHLLDNQTANTSSAKWVELSVNEIEYNIEDDENEDNNIFICELNLTLINYNPI
tara:strand:+ start:1455 stop:1892 length:438 start_codon:yes stop_codon:yes gene_type:complete